MTDNLLTTRVESFEELLVIVIQGGVAKVVWGTANVQHFVKIDSREPKRTLVFDLDNPELLGNVYDANLQAAVSKLFKEIIDRETGETLYQYRNVLMGLEEEQRLEPETQWEFDQT